MKNHTEITRIMVILAACTLLLSVVLPVRAEVPTNDDFINPFEIWELPFSTGIDTSEATQDGNDPYPCGYPPYNSVWFKYTAIGDSILTVSTSGSSYQTALGIYTLGADNELLEKGCSSHNQSITFSALAGEQFYFLVADTRWEGPYPEPPGGEGGGWLQFHLSEVERPPNDDFVAAQEIPDLPFSSSGNIILATIENEEPRPYCSSEVYRSVWYRYTPSETQLVQASINTQFEGVLAVYQGSQLGDLSRVTCQTVYDYWAAAFQAEAGETYYFQVGSSWDYSGNWEFTFNLHLASMPEVNFSYWPYEPSIYDTVTFYSDVDMWSGMVEELWWLFPGEDIERTGEYQTFTFPNDGDYAVQHGARFIDGSEDSITKTISIRTHDVSIVKVTVPITARSGQTKEISIGLRNTRYPEVVIVELYKSNPYWYDGYELVGWSRNSVPARSNGRTTEFVFNYTFTAEDAQVGKVTFKAVATIENYPDALPADNTYISLPVKISR